MLYAAIGSYIIKIERCIYQLNYSAGRLQEKMEQAQFIFSIVFVPDKRILLNSKIYIPPKYWNKRFLRISNELPTVFGCAGELNEKLDRLIRFAEDIIYGARKKDIVNELPLLKKSFNTIDGARSVDTIVMQAESYTANRDNQLNFDLYHQIDDYIKSKERKVCKDMPRIYRNMKEHIKAFEDFRQNPITFECLDLNFYEEFVDFLTFDYIQRRRINHIVGLK